VSRSLAAVACVVMAAAWGCGGREERPAGPSPAEVRALVTEGLATVGAGRPGLIRFRAAGGTLGVRVSELPPRGPAMTLAAALGGVRAELRRFCPKPALLRCRLALVAGAAPGSRHATTATADALRELARRRYGVRPLLRRRGPTTRIVTANGELLAAVRAPAGGSLSLSFGGLRPPPGTRAVAQGRLQLEAGPAVLAVARRALSPTAREALAGVRRLVLTAPLSKNASD
jgi:hypothetical protein